MPKLLYMISNIEKLELSRAFISFRALEVQYRKHKQIVYMVLHEFN